MNGPYLDFEKPIYELEKKIGELKDLADRDKDDPLESLELSHEIEALEMKLEKLSKEIYSKLSRWQRVQLARHPRRPCTLDYVSLMTTDFIELHGDRNFADDKAIVGGFAKLDGKPVLVVGQQKGKDTKQKLFRNFGMPHPEGYRKALRLMQLASRFDKPIIVLVDTPGAFPGIGAEERGQAEAIARNLREMTRLRVPIIINVIGEGASGGALGIGVGDRVFMLENSWYSVISPEGCAAILWRDSARAPEAAEALKLSATDLLELKVIDKIIPEPIGGAHKYPNKQAQILKGEILNALDELEKLNQEELIERRIHKFRVMGEYLSRKGS
ncbi:MAG: acetyl-CoA carboxylase carboxyltransferase subunit alpha [candidate division Zixibacteria bacterium]|nr:acetyl-CoA carboxylase carboxyltransferase subunit alpha [candidate division Zixibacteria bacterium]